MNLHLPVTAVGHTGQSRHRFALASCGKNTDFIISVTIQFFRLDKGSLRCFEIAHFQGNPHDIHHGTAEDANFSLIRHSGIYCHLDTGYVRGKRCQNDTSFCLAISFLQRLGNNSF